MSFLTICSISSVPHHLTCQFIDFYLEKICAILHRKLHYQEVFWVAICYDLLLLLTLDLVNAYFSLVKPFSDYVTCVGLLVISHFILELLSCVWLYTIPFCVLLTVGEIAVPLALSIKNQIKTPRLLRKLLFSSMHLKIQDASIWK